MGIVSRIMQIILVLPLDTETVHAWNVFSLIGLWLDSDRYA